MHKLVMHFFRLSLNENSNVQIQNLQIYTIRTECALSSNTWKRNKTAAYAKVEIRRQATILKQFAREHLSFHI